MTSSPVWGELSEPNNLKYIEWKIPNFTYLSQQPCPQLYYNSPTFIFENISWHIDLHPFDSLSIFLINETQQPRNVNYSFSIKTSKCTLFGTKSGNATIQTKSGFHYFIDSDEVLFGDDKLKLSLLPSDNLTIVCILKPGENEKQKQVFYYTAPKADRMISNRIGELSEPNILRQLEWKLPGFDLECGCSDEEFVISPTFIFKNTSWHISLRSEDLGLFLSNETQCPCHVNYSFSIKNSKGTLFAYKTNDEIIKNKSGFTNYYDALWEDKAISMPTDSLTVVCVLKPGERGKEASNYTALKADNCNLKSGVESWKLMKLKEPDVLSKNLKDLLNNKDYCDTILRVKNKEFYAHRAILMARSSVFAAMFQHDTAEKRTGIVNIPDCDVNTFQEFLEYLYSGELEVVSFDSAFQLYSTSDKYNVQELKTFCTKCMMQSLTVQNICDVVILADKYDEAMLYSASQEFFNGNFKEILKTSEWESFLKINYRLANKILIGMSESKK